MNGLGKNNESSISSTLLKINGNYFGTKPIYLSTQCMRFQSVLFLYLMNSSIPTCKKIACLISSSIDIVSLLFPQFVLGGVSHEVQ